MILTIVYWAFVSIEFIHARDLRQYIPRVNEYQHKIPNDEVRLTLDNQPNGYNSMSISNTFPYFIENQQKITQISQFNQPVNNNQNIIFTLINNELKKHPMFNYNYILNLINNQLKIQPNINNNDLQYLIDRQLQNIENQRLVNQQPGFVYNYEMQRHQSPFFVMTNSQIPQAPKVNFGFGQTLIPTNDNKKLTNNAYQVEDLQKEVFSIINEEIKKYPNAKFNDILLLIEQQIKRQPNINKNDLRVLISNQLKNLYSTNNARFFFRNQDPDMFFTDKTNSLNNPSNLEFDDSEESSSEDEDDFLSWEQDNDDDISVEDQSLQFGRNIDLIFKGPPTITERNDIALLVEEPIKNKEQEDVALLVDDPALVINNNEDQTNIMKVDEKEINQDNIFVILDDTEKRLVGPKFDTNEIVDGIGFVLANGKIVYNQSKFKYGYNDLINLMNNIPSINYNFRGVYPNTNNKNPSPVRTESRFAEKTLSKNKTLDNRKVDSKNSLMKKFY